MQLQISKNATPRMWILPAVLTMLYSVFTGCVTMDKMIKPVPVEQTSPVTPATSVTPLEDGRLGFAITEVANMDDAWRSDFDRAVALLKEQDYDGAIELLEKLIEQAPDVTAPYIDLGMAYARSDKPKLAEAHFKTALQMVPGHPVASNEYGLLCRRAGRFDEARALYEKALAAFPDYFPVHRNLGILCDIYMNDLEGALAHYQIYSQALPEDGQVKLWIADLRARLGDN